MNLSHSRHLPTTTLPSLSGRWVPKKPAENPATSSSKFPLYYMFTRKSQLSYNIVIYAKTFQETQISIILMFS